MVKNKKILKISLDCYSSFHPDFHLPFLFFQNEDVRKAEYALDDNKTDFQLEFLSADYLDSKTYKARKASSPNRGI